jgi:CDP-2,3-bis-(O-geranylgeranyl)-sn-glycerol synthase
VSPSHFLALLVFMLPAYAANMAAPFVRFWKGWNPPIDARRLGSHKTVLGFVAGVGAAVLAAFLLSLAGEPALADDPGRWLSFGLLMGLGAMAGDALKSFFKRRLHVAPGRPWVPFDQLDFQVGALLVAGHRGRLQALDVAVILCFGFLADLAVNRLAYRLRIKDTPW